MEVIERIPPCGRPKANPENRPNKNNSTTKLVIQKFKSQEKEAKLN